jgi:hypothetical protein
MPLAVLSHDPDKPSPIFPPDLAKPTNDSVGENAGGSGASLDARDAGDCEKQFALHPIDRPDVVIEGVRSVVEQARRRRHPSRTDSTDSDSIADSHPVANLLTFLLA